MPPLYAVGGYCATVGARWGTPYVVTGTMWSQKMQKRNFSSRHAMQQYNLFQWNWKGGALLHLNRVLWIRLVKDEQLVGFSTQKGLSPSAVKSEIRVK